MKGAGDGLEASSVPQRMVLTQQRAKWIDHSAEMAPWPPRGSFRPKHHLSTGVVAFSKPPALHDRGGVPNRAGHPDFLTTTRAMAYSQPLPSLSDATHHQSDRLGWAIRRQPEDLPAA